MKIGRLFIGAQRCTDPREFVIASWSYVTGYWRWALYFRGNRACSLRFGGAYGEGRHFTPGGGRLRHPFSCNLSLPFIGYFHLSTQPALPAMKTWGARS